MKKKETKKRLGELLKEKGIITEAHIKYALQVQKITRHKLGEIFEKLGFVTEHDTVLALAEQSGIPYLDVDEVLPDNDILKMFNKKFCLNNTFLPIRRLKGAIAIAGYNIGDEKLGQLISRQTGLKPKFLLRPCRMLSPSST